MKKLILLLVAIWFATNSLQGAINEQEISTAIKNLTTSINSDQALNNKDIDILRANLKIAAPLQAGVGKLIELASKLNELLTTMKNSMTKCGSYSKTLEIFKILFDNSDSSLQKLLNEWDKKSNYQKPAREKYLSFYSDAAALYLRLLIAQEYLTNNEINELTAAAIDKVIGDLVPNNLNDATFKNSINTANLETQRNNLIGAFKNLTKDNKNFIKDYCQLQEEYAKGDWKNDKKYWTDIKNYDVDDPYDDLDEWGDTDDKITILKNYLKQRITPLYKPDLQTTQNNLSLWIGQGNDVLSRLEKDIKSLEPQKTAQEVEGEIFTDYINEAKNLFKKALLNLIDEQTFKADFTKLREKISSDSILSPETKNGLLTDEKFNLMNLEAQKHFAKPLITYLSPQNIDDNQAVQEMEKILLKTLDSFPKNITNLAGAAELTKLQKNYFEIAKNIYDLNFKKADDLPKGPSPQDNTNRDTVNAYIRAATLLEKKPNPNTPEKTELENQIQIINTASEAVWKNIKSWLPAGIKDIKEEYEAFVNPKQQQQSPISQQELLTSLTNLNVELMALRSRI